MGSIRVLPEVCDLRESKKSRRYRSRVESILIPMDQRKQYESLFPEYLFVNLVGQGSYGDVFFCIRKSDKKKVAIKVV